MQCQNRQYGLRTRIFSSAPLDVIILDPQLFNCFDQTFIGEIVHRHSSLQIIIHTYADSIGEIKPDNNIHLVEKNGQSIGLIKAIIRNCFEIFQRKERP